MNLSTLSREELKTWDRKKLEALAELKRQGALPRAASDFSAYRERPVAFCREVLGGDPWKKQREIMHAIATQPRVTIRSGRGVGKTWVAAQIVLWFIATRPGSIVITTAPTGRQVRDLLWRQIRASFSRARRPLPGRCLTTQIDCGADWYATGFATDEEVRFQGPHSAAGVLIVGDEAAGLPEWFHTAVEGLQTQEGAKLLLVGNPNYAGGGFYESHRHWPPEQRFHISALEAPEHLVRPGWCAEMLAKYGEESPVYQVHVLGNFPPQGADSIISMAWVEAAQARDLDPGEPVEMGVDVARYGTDDSAVYVRAGSVVVASDVWHGNDTMETAGRVAALAEQWNPETIKVDEIGVGAGVLDRLHELGLPALGVNVSTAALDSEHFANRRAEIFDGLATRLKEGDISLPPADTELLNQLTMLTIRYNSRGQRQLVSKEELRKRGLASPDRADALALCFAAGDDSALLLGVMAQAVSRGGWMPRR